MENKSVTKDETVLILDKDENDDKHRRASLKSGLEIAKEVSTKLLTKYGKDLIKNGLVSQGACPISTAYGLNVIADYTKNAVENKDNPFFNAEEALHNSVMIGTGATVGGMVAATAGGMLCGPVCAFVGGAVGGTIGAERVKQGLKKVQPPPPPQSSNFTASVQHPKIQFKFQF